MIKKHKNKILLVAAIFAFLFNFYFILSSTEPIQAALTKFQLTNPADLMQIKIDTIKFTEPVCDQGDAKGENVQCEIPWIGQYIVGVYKYAMGIVGIVATVVMMYGGFMWIMAAGNASRISEAKTWIGGAMTGLVLALGSYTLLYVINPDLVSFKPLKLTLIDEEEQLIEAKTGAKSQEYKDKNCPSGEELAAGVEIYATGYYKPAYGTTHKALCMLHMQCSDCPNGVDTSTNCDDIFPKIKNYHPCKSFPEGADYCKATASGHRPVIGDIAAPDCISFGTKVCVDGTTYTVSDRGGVIDGKRIDIWTGDSRSAANAVTGNKTMKAGACQ